MIVIQTPTVVQEAMNFFAPVFSNVPQVKHVSNILTGLIISFNKTITGMTNIFPNASDQSCMNRFLNEADWDAEALNKTRIAWLQNYEDTKFHQDGVIALDDTLIEKSGASIKDVGKLYDHSKHCYILGQDVLFINYVHPTSGKHYPLEFRRFKKEKQCQWTNEDFKKIPQLGMELIGWSHEQGVPGAFTFDSYYSSAELLNYVNSLKNADETNRRYVGDLKFNRKIIFKGTEMSVEEFAKTIPASDRKPVTTEDGTKQWYLAVNVKAPKVDHKVRIVILWKYKNDVEPRKILVSNSIFWDAKKIVGIYRKRWTGTETFHRDGKQELGLGDCQIRNEAGQTRHAYLVMLAYSLLVHELDKTSLSEWAHEKLTSIGACCRAMAKESMRNVIMWVVDQLDFTGKTAKRARQLLARLKLT